MSESKHNMLIYLLASPRSGNNWLRRVLSHSLGYKEYASHRLEELPRSFDSDAIFNVHAACTESNLRYIRDNEYRIVALARHPLDVFVSVLQFARQVPEVHLWLGGECKIPSDVLSLAPNDSRYVEWMCSPGAEVLLSVSLGWWNCDMTTDRVKYEDLIADPIQTIEGIIDRLGLRVLHPIQDALNLYTVEWFSKFRNHGWLGTPNAYTKFLTAETCRVVWQKHRKFFNDLEYDLIENVSLSDEQARINYFNFLPGK